MKELRRVFHAFIYYRHTKWPRHRAAREVPAELHGKRTNIGPGLLKIISMEIETIEDHIRCARKSLGWTAEGQRNYQWKNKRPTKPFSIGDKVLRAKERKRERVR